MSQIVDSPSTLFLDGTDNILTHPKSRKLHSTLLIGLEDDDRREQELDDIALSEPTFHNFSQRDIQRMLSNAESHSPASQRKVRGWIAEIRHQAKCGKKIEAKTAALTTLGFGAFCAMVATIGDKFIDKFVDAVAKLCHFTQSVLFHGLGHAAGHAICVGFGFLISFAMEWVFLYYKKNSKTECFDSNNKQNNKKIYNELWRRSLMANLGTFLPIAVVGTLLCVLTGGIGCVVAIVGLIVVGCAIKWSIKRMLDSEKRRYYQAIKLMEFENCHQTFDMDELLNQYVWLTQNAKNKYRNDGERSEFIDDLGWAYGVMMQYFRIRYEDKGLIAAKVEAFIVEKDKSSCLVM